MSFSNRIIPRIFGGLGNQLFIYAAARRLALKNNAELVIDDISGFERDDKYQRHYQLDHFDIPCRKATAGERLEPFSRVRRFLKRLFSSRLPFEKRNYIYQEGIDFDSRLLNLSPNCDVYLEGYWQSENYFKDVEHIIRTDLKIKAPMDRANQEMAGRIQSSLSVAMHVRFFDELHGSGSHNAPSGYYQRAVQYIESLVPNAHYYLFSDCPDEARTRIQLPTNRVTCISHNQGDEVAYADLWLMSQCHHFIIANSTFSWWGAWLSNNSKKIVTTPGIRLGNLTAWGFRGLLPDTWHKIDFN